MMHRNKSVSQHAFAMVPRADIPRAKFNMEKGYKTTFDSGYLVPVFCEEVLPGDSWNVKMTAFARLATPIFPIMDNLHLDTFFFFVPNRIVWSNWKKFMGEQLAPGDSIVYALPTLTSPVGGYPIGSVQDYFGLPTVGQVGGGNSVIHQCLPLRGYQLIYNEWFRDENLCSPFSINYGDGPDALVNYALVKRGKRHDYFTGCLPWPQKGSTAITIPLGATAPVKSDGTAIGFGSTGGGANTNLVRAAGSGTTITTAAAGNAGNLTFGPVATATTGLYADLQAATGATINALRQSFQIQKLLERDARGGTRYTEIVRSHFGVVSPDARLQRPEYLGGGSSPIIIQPVAQQSASNITGGSTPLGNLAAIGTVVANRHGFSQSFTEHGYIIGIVNVRADLTYQQGLRRHWSRSTRYDFYFPAFAMLGEQAVLNKEIYCDGGANDGSVFGYQERWAEYRYTPSEITALFRSTAAGTLDGWHLAQKFTSLPTLGTTFIQETPPVDRILAVASVGKQFIFDSVFHMKVARPMPLYSVPGLIDHF